MYNTRIITVLRFMNEGTFKDLQAESLDQVQVWSNTLLNDLTGQAAPGNQALRNTYADALNLETNKLLGKLLKPCFPSKTPVPGFWLSLVTIKGKTRQEDKKKRKDVPGCLAEKESAIAENIRAYVAENTDAKDHARLQSVEDFKDKFLMAVQHLKDNLDKEMRKKVSVKIE